jgi:hypothetical protein
MDDSDINRSIGRLEGKLDSLVTSVNTLASSFKSLEEGRLSQLEREFSLLTGKITIIMVGVSAGISFALYIAERYLLR